MIALSLVIVSLSLHIIACCFTTGNDPLPRWDHRAQAAVWGGIGLSTIGALWGVVP